MKILVTGARGFVGTRIMQYLQKKEDFLPIEAPSFQSYSKDDISRLLEEVTPDIIIHTAAISDIGSCEKDPEASYLANVNQPLWLAQSGIKTIIFSTDQVYSGCISSGPYLEGEVLPANTYARHKLEMEEKCLEADPKTVLLRATWMYDMPMYQVANRGNFLVNMLFQNEAAFSSNQHRAVTYVRQVAENTVKAIQLPGGIYNFGSENDLSMLETAEWLKERLHLPIVLKDAGERHPLWMDCSKLKMAGIFFDTTIEGLERCIHDYHLNM